MMFVVWLIGVLGALCGTGLMATGAYGCFLKRYELGWLIFAGLVCYVVTGFVVCIAREALLEQDQRYR